MSMNVAEKMKLFVKQHNSRWHMRYGEIAPFLTDGFACVAHGQYMAACLCFITGIEMSLRLPLLHDKQLDLRNAWDPKGTGVPLLSNKLLLDASKIGLRVDLLRTKRDPDHATFMANLACDKYAKQVGIVRFRNNICHGNLNILVREVDGWHVVPNADIEQEARELESVVLAWSEAFGAWHTAKE